MKKEVEGQTAETVEDILSQNKMETLHIVCW